MLEVKIRKTLAGFDLDVDFAVDDGILSILGPSGSGKTMTLQCIAGLMRPDEGHIRLGGRILFDSSSGINLPAKQRRVGFVFQNYALFPHLTARQNIAYGVQGLPRRQRDMRVSSLLARMNVRELGDRYPRQLSSGEQQRVALARALITEPDILLLDEPFSALDIINKEGLELELLDVERSFGGSILFVTHDFSQGYRLGSRIAVFESGRVVQCDTKSKVISSPANHTVAKLMGLRNLITGSVSGIDGTLVRIAVPELDCDIKAIVNGDTRLQRGQSVTIGIHPEKARLVELAEENTFWGSVDHVVEGVAAVTVFFRAEGPEGRENYLLATSSTSGGPRVREGDRCYLQFPPEDVVVIAGPPRATAPAHTESIEVFEGTPSGRRMLAPVSVQAKP